MPRKLSWKRLQGELNADAGDLKRELVRFGQKFLAVLYSVDAIAVRRLSIAESRHSDTRENVIRASGRSIEKQSLNSYEGYRSGRPCELPIPSLPRCTF